jgi:hypothetical protein
MINEIKNTKLPSELMYKIKPIGTPEFSMLPHYMGCINKEFSYNIGKISEKKFKRLFNLFELSYYTEVGYYRRFDDNTQISERMRYLSALKYFTEYRIPTIKESEIIYTELSSELMYKIKQNGSPEFSILPHYWSRINKEFSDKSGKISEKKFKRLFDEFELSYYTEVGFFLRLDHEKQISYKMRFISALKYFTE